MNKLIIHQNQLLIKYYRHKTTHNFPLSQTTQSTESTVITKKKLQFH